MPHHRLVRGALLAPTLVASLAGCYVQVPVAGASPATGTTVSAELTDQGTYDLTPRIGASVREVQGRVIAADDSTLTLALSSAVDARGIPTTWTGEQIAFRRAHLARVSERRLSRKRSWLLAGGLLALVVLAGGMGLSGGGAAQGEGGNPQ